MNVKGLISIIVPVYNVENFIENCIRSVYHQTYSNWELILVDDHSSDGSKSICDKYANSNSKIVLYENESKGVSSARNLGVSRANGEWICFIDSDDEIKQDALEKLICNSEERDLVVAGFSILDIEKKEERIFLPEPFDGDIKSFASVIEKYTSRVPFLQGPCWKLFKTKLLVDNSIVFPEYLSYGEDAYFVYEYLEIIKSVKVIDELVYKYYVRGRSLSHGFKVEKYKINLMLNEKLNKLCTKFGLDKEEMYLDNNRNSFSTYLNEIAMNGKDSRYISYIREAVNMHETQASFCGKKMSTKKRIIGLLVRMRAYHLLFLIARINIRTY